MKEIKQQTKLQKLKCRRLLMGRDVLLSHETTSRPINKSVMIQFCVIDNDEIASSPLVKKVLDDQLYKKVNYRAMKALMKVNDDRRKKNDTDCMNMLGLDIRRIGWQIQNKKDEQHGEHINKQCHLRKSRDSALSRLKSTSRTYAIRNNTEEMLEDKIEKAKLEMTQSAIFHSAEQHRKQQASNKKAKKYLYERLAQKPLSKKKAQLNLVYEKRIKSYIQLLWKVAFSHNIFLEFNLEDQDFNRTHKFKAYVGPGNNCSMIKGLLKRRFWWNVIDDKNADDINFVWTQIKVNSIFEFQHRSLRQKPQYIESDDQQKQQKQQHKSSIKFPKRYRTKKQYQNYQLFNFKILNQIDVEIYKKYYDKYQLEKSRTYTFRKQNVKKVLRQQNSNNLVHNHLQNNFYLGNKKALFYNLKQYYQLINENVYDYIPLTFHIKKGFKDIQYKRFVSYYQKRKNLIKKEENQDQENSKRKSTRNIWIVKPGQNSNRGRGITVIDQIYQLNQIMKETQKDTDKTYIVQLYIDRPFLYCNRKFDIRHYMLITNIHGITKAYWYSEGYIRTSSYQFNIFQFEPQIHLTNDAIQKKYPEYGRYEPANKISYSQFQRYLDANYKEKKYNFKRQILTKMKKMATDAARSVYTKIAPKNQKHNFEILGLDFMIDRSFRPWLIEINTNPCLEVNCPLLDRIIPYMVQQSFKLTLDIIYPPPCHYPNTCKHLAPLVDLEVFKYQLVFDSQLEGDILTTIYKKTKGNLIDQIGQISQDQIFKDDGKQIKLDDFS